MPPRPGARTRQKEVTLLARRLFMALAASSALLAGSLGAHAEDKIRISFLSYVQPGDLLFEIIHQGAKDAARDLGVDLNIEYASLDPVALNNLIDTAVSNKVDGIAVSITDGNAYQDSVCRAVKAGVPVISFNVDDPKGGDHSCRLAFVGQDFVTAGYALGKRVAAEGHLKKGDVVFTPVEFPEASYANLRRSGVQKALDEVGAVTDMVGTGNNPPDVLDRMTQYLLGHPHTAAMVTLGSVTGRMAVKAAADTGLKGLPIGTFDNSTEITQGLLDGTIIATADQQPYSQGYLPVLQLVLLKRYGLFPSDVATGGHGLTDKASLSSLKDVSKLLGTYR